MKENMIEVKNVSMKFNLYRKRFFSKTRFCRYVQKERKNK